MRRTTEDRLKEKCVPEPNSGCWLWIGTLGKNGYAYMHSTELGISTVAHRVSYELAKGPIPDGLEIDHRCKNRGCVNPGHLEAVTHLENIRRAAHTNKTACTHGHPYTPENTGRQYGDKGRYCLTCSRDWAKTNNERRRSQRALARAAVS